MYESLYNFFILNKKLSLPGVGSFHLPPGQLSYLEDRSAIEQKSRIVNFSHLEDEASYLSMVGYLCRQERKEENFIIEQVRSLSEFIRGKIKSEGQLFLPGLGTLSKDKGSDGIVFSSIVFESKHWVLPKTLIKEELKESEIPVDLIQHPEQKHEDLLQPLADNVNVEATEEKIVEHEVDPELIEKQHKQFWIWLIAIIILVLLIAGGVVLYYFNLL